MRPIFIFTDDLLTHNYVEDANDAESQIIIYRISLMDTLSFCYDFKDLYFYGMWQTLCQFTCSEGDFRRSCVSLKARFKL